MFHKKALLVFDFVNPATNAYSPKRQRGGPRADAWGCDCAANTLPNL